MWGNRYKFQTQNVTISISNQQVRKRVNKLNIIGIVAIELRSHAFNLSLNKYLEKNKTNGMGEKITQVILTFSILLFWNDSNLIHEKSDCRNSYEGVFEQNANHKEPGKIFTTQKVLISLNFLNSM